MSRARPIVLGKGENGEPEKVWFDTKLNGKQATDEQLELLALGEQIELDELLDADLSQADIIERLRNALDQNGIPDDVLQRREEWREERHALPCCRICGKEGDSTKHHFVNRWILKELVDYAWRWSNRNINTVPLCIHCHRLLHLRSSDVEKSIVHRLTDTEKVFVQAALDQLEKERPRLALLIARGDGSVYETRLLRDWIEGKFRVADPEPASPAKQLLAQAA